MASVEPHHSPAATSPRHDPAPRAPIGGNGPDGGTPNKWFPDGRPRPFPGNTFLATDPDPRFAAALGAVSAHLDRSRAAGAFARLPDDTMHTTVLNGTISAPGLTRRWPTHISQSESLERVTGDFTERLRSVRLQVPDRLRFAVSGISDLADPSTQLEVLLEPDASTGEALDALRICLSELLGLPEPGLQRFHVTLAYRIRPWPDTASLRQLQQDLASMLPAETVFHAVHFTRFDDMTRYVRLLQL